MAETTRYRLTPSARTAVAVAGGVEVCSRLIEADTWRLLLEFEQPRTVAEVASRVEATLGDFESYVRTFVQWGLLASDLASKTTADGPNLKDALAPELLEPERFGRISSLLRQNRAVAIPDALDPALAEEVHAALFAHRSWQPLEVAQPFFHYRTHHLQDEALFPEPLKACRRLFASASTKRFAEELTGADCSGLPTFAASWYQPGEYSLPHSDAGQNRSVAFVWHLTRDWERSFGGELFWCPTGRALTPSFNCLTLFRVWGGSTHLVCPVGLHAVGKRLAVAGWWTCEGDEWSEPKGSANAMSPWIAGYGPPGCNDPVEDPRFLVF